MLDVVLAGVTGLVLAVLLSRPQKPPAPDKDPDAPAPAADTSTSAERARRIKSKWD